MNAEGFFSERSITALVLIACFAIFAVGGMLYTGRAIWKWPAGQTIGYLRWERGFIILAVLVTALGLVLLEDLLSRSGASLIARLGLVAYLIAAVVVVIAETSYLNTGKWNYPQIVFYVLVALLAQAAFGVALLQTSLLPPWVGWTAIIWNVALLLIFSVLRPDEVYYPALHHFIPLLIGIALLRKV